MEWCTLAEAREMVAPAPDSLDEWIGEGLVQSREVAGVVQVKRLDVSRCLDSLASAVPPKVRSGTQQSEALEKKLRRANHLAQVGTMAMSVGHEINNPLTYVLGNNQYMQSDLLPELKALLGDSERGQALLEEMQELCDEIDEGATHIGRIVAELRGLARRKSECKPVEPMAAVHAALRMASPAWSSTVSVSSELSEVREVLVNEVHLTQVLMNLFTNAAHALQGIMNPEIRVGLREEDGKAVVEVHDNGAGIPDAVVARVFDPFFTTKPIGEGTGFGLSVCKQLVEEMGGTLTLQTESGRGTTVRVSIPLMTPSTDVFESPEVLGLDLRGRSAIVIDDEPRVLAAMKRILESLGLIVTCTDDPTTAVGQILEGDSDLILCDLMMPKMTGMAVYREVMAKRPDKALKFTFVSGGPSSEEARAFAHAHADRMLGKPLDKAQVHHQLSMALQYPLQQSEPCPNLTRCPMFPRFQSEQMLSIYRKTYCEAVDGSFMGCARYRSMKGGVRPAPTLLPNGEELPE